MIPTQPQTREECVIILDYLPHGYPFEQGTMKSPIAQGLGNEHLTLLELIPKKGVDLQPHRKPISAKVNEKQFTILKAEFLLKNLPLQLKMS